MTSSSQYHNNEKALLLRVAASDERAFGQLVNLYWGVVYEHALMYLKAPMLAEETALDVFEKIWRKRDKLPAVTDFKDWLFIVGRNEFISRLRKKLADPAAPGSPEWWREEVQVPASSLELKELSRVIEAGINSLKPHQREIFLLSREQGLTHEQIATKLGLSKHTVKGHLVNTLNYLRQYLKENADIFLAITTLVAMLYRRP